MAFQSPAIAHELDGDAITDVNVCELGPLKIAVDMQRSSVNDAESRMARRKIVARSELDICRDAIHRRQDGGPFQIQVCDVSCCGRLGERSLCLAYGGFGLGDGGLELSDARSPLFDCFRRHKAAELAIAKVLPAGLLPGGGLDLDPCLRLLQPRGGLLK